MDRETRLKRLRFRAWHRGTKEADLLIGGFFDHYHDRWNEEQILWFEQLMHEEDVEIMGWAFGTMECPAYLRGPMMDALMKLDYIPVAR